MQKDCHYYGTYYMATQAGFNHEEAEKIAWAAQSVDEMDHDVVRKLRDNAVELEKNKDKSKKNETLKKEYTELYYNVVTVHDFIFYLFQKEWTRQDSLLQMSKQIESVWSVFHFLPANITDNELKLKDRSPELKTVKIEGYDTDFAEKKYKKDLKLVCKPSSKLANQIFQFVLDFVKSNSTPESGFSDEVLFSIGIFMHVIADTWSHQDFCGSCNMHVNRGAIVESGNRTSFEPNWGEIGLGKIAWLNSKWFEYTGKDTPFRCFSAIWTGHGTSGSFPDIPGKKYTYIPDYSNSSITVDNPDRFRKAFAQMYYIMKALYEKNEYEISSNVDIPDFVENAGKICFTDGDEKDRCELWNTFLEKKLKEYDKNNENCNSKVFLIRAYEYRKFALEKIAKEIINDPDYYKDVETLTIKELMSSKFEEALNALGTVTQYLSENGLVKVQDSLGNNLDKLGEKLDESMFKLLDQLSVKGDVWDKFSHEISLQNFKLMKTGSSF
ncbi:DUF6765 family protein [Fibrobacter sp. HC4]|uniref:DUF6765 family protein n=1 Tax=Fibrobacter sp. HC4 TaxID=3239812 RepID=UPI0020196B8C|nr:DUF6765 family protein [Fibrobacter succinogenes]MCL4102513.1 hypothetical protein [Fibrobacter succinogenes]